MKTTKIGWSKMLTVGMPTLVGTLLAVLVMTGCATDLWEATRPAKVWDETLSAEETAHILSVIPNNLKITAYNGVLLEKEYPAIKIPSGDARLSINMDLFVGGLYSNTHYKAEGMEFDYFFEGGKRYFVYVRRNEEADDYVYGVEIYDQAPNAVGGGNPEGSFVAFVPFRNQPVFK